MRWYFLAFLLLLAACSPAGVKPDYSLAKAAVDGKGLLVVSITTDEPNSPYIPNLQFQYGSSPRGDAETLEGPKGCDPNQGDPSDFKDACGRLWVVELAAGDYYVQPWLMELFPPVRNCAPTDWQPIKFSIVAGKVTYLGDIHARLKPGSLDRLGDTKIGFAWAETRDSHVRDLALLLQRYPNIGAGDVIQSPLTFPRADDPAHPPDENCGTP